MLKKGNFQENLSLNELHQQALYTQEEKVLKVCFATKGHYLVPGALLCGSHAWSARRGSARERAPPQLACSPGSYVEQLVLNLMGCFAAGDHAPRARSQKDRELPLAGGGAPLLAHSQTPYYIVLLSVGRSGISGDRPSDVA